MTDWVAKLKAGDVIAFEALYRQYHQKVYWFVSKQTNNTTLREDLVHDAFLKLWENRSRLSIDLPIEAQLFVTTRQIVINFFQREVLQQKVQHYFATQNEPAGASIPDEEIFTQLNKAIDALPPKRQQIFRMSKFEGLTYEEIAEALSISKNTVESHMVKAFKFLRERLSCLPFF
jgi:RNA polymerase sigma-70 factor (ECF subfamily)